jgi:hypothetical protein
MTSLLESTVLLHSVDGYLIQSGWFLGEPLVLRSRRHFRHQLWTLIHERGLFVGQQHNCVVFIYSAHNHRISPGIHAGIPRPIGACFAKNLSSWRPSNSTDSSRGIAFFASVPSILTPQWPWAYSQTSVHIIALISIYSLICRRCRVQS